MALTQFEFWNIIGLGLPEKKTEKKPEVKKANKCVDKCICEADLGRMFTKKRKDDRKSGDDGKNCILSEYMDSISRNGANFLEKQNMKEEARMSKSSANK